MIQHSLKLLLVQECIDYKAACDLHHITQRHLFQATQLLWTHCPTGELLQTKNQILSSGPRVITFRGFLQQ